MSILWQHLSWTDHTDTPCVSTGDEDEGLDQFYGTLIDDGY